MSIGKDLLTSSKTRNGDFNWKRSGLTSSKTRNGDFNWKRSGLTSKINMFVLFCRASKIGNSLFSFSRAGTMIPSVTSPPQSPLFFQVKHHITASQKTTKSWTLKNDEKWWIRWFSISHGDCVKKILPEAWKSCDRFPTDALHTCFIKVSNFQFPGGWAWTNQGLPS